MAVLYSRALAAEAGARLEAATAERVTEFMVDLFEVSDPGESRGNTVTAREILDAGATRIGRELAAEPDVQARLMEAIGLVYRNLGLYREAEGLLSGSVELRRRTRARAAPRVPRSPPRRTAWPGCT
jgi:serine/threonine-protein kinase